jgi:hypothetical protein
MKAFRKRFVAFTSVALSLAVAGAAATQRDSSLSPPPGVVYSNNSLGFRYRPLGGMQDETKSRRAKIQSRAESLRTTKTLDLLLAMSSGLDDTAPEWNSLSIEAYPRKAFSDLDDVSAEARMSAWVAGIGGSLETAGGPGFDPFGITNRGGAPSFAFFAKGGSRNCLRNLACSQARAPSGPRCAVCVGGIAILTQHGWL